MKDHEMDYEIGYGLGYEAGYINGGRDLESAYYNIERTIVQLRDTGIWERMNEWISLTESVALLVIQQLEEFLDSVDYERKDK